MRLVILLLTAVFLFNGCAAMQPKSQVNIYRYDEPPDVCFFPKEQAKWDGYKITNKNWNQLNDYLKFMFILEAVRELEKKESVMITLTDSNRTLLALNYGVDKLSKDLPNTEVTMISFFYDVLKDAKMVTPRNKLQVKK